MFARDIVVIGGSAGAISPLSEIIGALGGFEGSIFVVIHVSSTAESALPAILTRAGGLTARHAVDGEPIRPGVVLVAPPDRHLMVGASAVQLTREPRENGARPAVDVLFRSAARAHGMRVVSIVLSGALDDGTMGSAIVKEHGGVCVVQRPEEALFSGMPRNAIASTVVDHVVSVGEIAPLLHRLSRHKIEGRSMNMSSSKASTTAPAPGAEQELARNDGENGRTATALSCPDCHGILMRKVDGILHFRCQIGHAHSPLALEHGQADEVEMSLAAAERGLRERAILLHMLADRARASNDVSRAANLSERAESFVQRAIRVRELITSASDELDG